MKTNALIGVAAASLLLGLSAGAWAADRHSPDAHMDQNGDRYHYEYDDGVCHYVYEYNFKDLKDHLEQHGDCRNVPIQRYRPLAAAPASPAYPPPSSAPPAVAPEPGSAPPAAIIVSPAPGPAPR